MNALNAGIKTIEHGSYLDDEAINLMLEKKAMLVATRTIVENILANHEGVPPESYKKLLETSGSHKKAYAAAVSSPWYSPCLSKGLIHVCRSKRVFAALSVLI